MINKEIYFDNSSTTMVCDRAINKVVEMMSKNYANPASLHKMGLSAEDEVEYSREIIANFIGASKDEIYFTSGGTEGNNLAIFGATSSNKKGKKIITSTIEHPSVLKVMDELEAQGFEVIRIKPDKYGVISVDDIKKHADDKTILISIMMVNNEIGAIQPVDKIKSILSQKESRALIHTDAVQAFGKININITNMGVDILTISGHKIHAPKGIGAIYIKKGTNLSKRVFGGGQEKDVRSGTVASQLIAGLGEAVLDIQSINKNYSHVKEIHDYALEKLKCLDFIKINSPVNSLPYILNFSVYGLKSETLLHYLSSCNIFVSSGSTCSKGKKSYVLKEIGLDNNRIDEAIRLSFSKYNKKQEVDIFIQKLIEAKNSLISSR